VEQERELGLPTNDHVTLQWNALLSLSKRPRSGLP